MVSTEIALYTDGSALGNPGPGGYGIILDYQGYSKELMQGFTLTTNNRMELLAVIIGLEALKKITCRVRVYSDSRYVVNPIEKKWLFTWEKRGFTKIKNPDLWKRFWEVYLQHDVQFTWLKGHTGHPMNEKCDALAKKAALHGPWAVDHGYLPQPTYDG